MNAMQIVRTCAWCCCCLIWLNSSWADAADSNEILDALLTEGVKFNDGRLVRMPAPTMRDGLGPAEQKKALASIADENHPVEALVRPSVVAPFVLKIGEEKETKTARPRRIDLWFVAYADLSKISDETFLKQQVAAEAKSEPRGSTSADGEVLTEEQLRERNIDSAPGERSLAGNFTLFDRVRLSGVMRAKLTRTDESVTLAGLLDPRFAKDAKYPNSWRPLERTDSGELRVGPPQPYPSAGWYAKATRLSEPKGAVFVEYHAVFDEPQGWFNGANLLRSKLPIVVQDGVRQFRRRMSAPAEKK
jgi:hypothetical protein